MPQLQAALDSAVIDKSLHVAQPSQTPDQPERDFGIPVLSALISMFQPLVPLAVNPNQDAQAILRSARELLQHHARAENKLDRYARAKLLDDIDGMLRLLPAANEHQLDIRSWLEDLPLNSRILASSPKPGCIHIAPLEQGGIIGRPHVFIVGLDDQNYPKTTAVDPILLDAERHRLSVDLTTADAISQRASSALQRVLARMRGLPEAQVRLSYSDRNLVNDQTNYPSPVLQELLKEM
ncbi:MAG: hypothetical protein IT423_11515 [Pirellulaceae bacterium]|nr:hypothetical protein [Pirellulaceae bacterium]